MIQSPPPPPTPTLPTLPQEDAALLAQLLDNSENIYTLASKSGRPLLDLLAWTSRPDIAAYIAHNRATRYHLLTMAALAALETIVHTSDSPIERRRAAATIIRAANPPASKPRPDRPENPRISPQDPTNGPLLNPFDPPEDEDLDEDLDDLPPSLGHRPPRPPQPTLDTLYLNSPGSIQTPEGAPLPHPGRTPEDVVAIVLAAFQSPDSPTPGAGYTTIYNFVPRAVDRSPESLDSFTRHIHNLTPDAVNFTSYTAGPLDINGKWATQTARLTLPSGQQRPFQIKLYHESFPPFENCWVLHHWSFLNST